MLSSFYACKAQIDTAKFRRERNQYFDASEWIRGLIRAVGQNNEQSETFYVANYNESVYLNSLNELGFLNIENVRSRN